MKILHVVYSLVPGCYRGGISKAVFELARHQAALGNDVTIYSTDRDLPRGHREAVVVLGSCFRIQYFRARFLPRFAAPEMYHAMVLNRRFFDVVVSHNNFLEFNCYVRNVFGATPAKIYYYPHGSLDPVVIGKHWFSHIKKHVYIALVERRNMAVAKGIFALTEREKEQLELLRVPCPIHVLGNGIVPFGNSQSACQAFRSSLGIADSPIILYIGRINPKKGIDRLISAFGALAKENKDCILAIGGDTSQDVGYTSRLNRLVAEWQVQNRVYWLGFLNEEQKIGAMSAATIFSHVSDSEGMAMAILEAMAAGLPTVVSDGCYMGDAVRAGALVQTEANAEALALVLSELLSDRWRCLCLSRTARSYVENYHSWKSIAEESVKIYNLV